MSVSQTWMSVPTAIAAHVPHRALRVQQPATMLMVTTPAAVLMAMSWMQITDHA